MENRHLEEILDALGGVIAEQKTQISVKKWEIADLKEKLEKAEAKIKELEDKQAITTVNVDTSNILSNINYTSGKNME